MKFIPEWCRNEAEVESKLIVQFLLPSLDYTPNDWYQEVTFNKIRLDFLVVPIKFYKSKLMTKLSWCVIMEAKHPKQNLDRHFHKFKRYLNTVKVKYGLITNGQQIRIYERINQDIYLVFNCSAGELEKNLGKIKALIGKKSINKKATKSNQLRLINSNSDKIKNIEQQGLINQQSDNSMKVITVYHNKGGVGKTTTVVNLAAALAKKGLRILIIDLDSQANTTFAVGLAKFLDEADDDLKDCHVYHLIRSGSKYLIPEVVRKTTFTKEPIDAIPSHIDLMKYERELVEIDAAKTRIFTKLQKVEQDYDVVLIDTPPSLNLYARVALITTDYLIIPSDLKPFANEGLKNVDNFVNEINEFRGVLGKDLINILGVLPTKISTNARFIQHTLPKRKENIKERYNFPLLETAIYEREDIAKALENSIIVGNLEIPDPRSVLDYKPDSLAASEFEMLALEVLEKIGVKV